MSSIKSKNIFPKGIDLKDILRYFGEYLNITFKLKFESKLDKKTTWDKVAESFMKEKKILSNKKSKKTLKQEKPKIRKMTGYNLFFKEKRSEVKDENMSSRDIMKEISRLWSELDDDEKDEWKVKALEKEDDGKEEDNDEDNDEDDDEKEDEEDDEEEDKDEDEDKEDEKEDKENLDDFDSRIKKINKVKNFYQIDRKIMDEFLPSGCSGKDNLPLTKQWIKSIIKSHYPSSEFKKYTNTIYGENYKGNKSLFCDMKSKQILSNLTGAILGKIYEIKDRPFSKNIVYIGTFNEYVNQFDLDYYLKRFFEKNKRPLYTLPYEYIPSNVKEEIIKKFEKEIEANN